MTLRHLNLIDFVIVNELDLSFSAGFTALTGETGAGKSIIIDAVQLLLGARGDAIWVRQNCNRCTLAAEFETNEQAQKWLLQNSFDEYAQNEKAQEKTVLLRRTIDKTGKSRAWINGSLATIAQLKEIGALLVEMHGQHAWQALMRPAATRNLLDDYAGADTQKTLSAWQKCQQLKSQLEKAIQEEKNASDIRERLIWQLGEIEKLSPKKGEWEELAAIHTKMLHAQSLQDAAKAALLAIEGGDSNIDRYSAGEYKNKTAGAQEQLSNAAGQLEGVKHIEKQFTPLVEQIESALAQIQDVSHSLSQWLRRENLEPEEFEKTDEKMSQWLAIARRWKTPPQQLYELKQTWQQELDNLNQKTDTAAIEKQLEIAQKEYINYAAELTQIRQKAAPQLAAAVTELIKTLAMPDARFEIALPPNEPSAHGLEGAVFQISPHKGQEMRAIDKIASGGELSRLSLAIAVATAQKNTRQAGTIIFDEVDSGIGGTVANSVGKLLSKLSKTAQVICITHLPQVAACAQNHLQVSKQNQDGQTISQITKLKKPERINEIARMLGLDSAGGQSSKTPLAHAKEILANNQAI